MYQDKLTNNPQEAWVENDRQNNAQASVSKAAQTDKRHYIVSIHASYETALSAKNLLTVDFGGTTQFQYHMDDELRVEFPTPVPLGENEKLDVNVPASGTADNEGNVTVTGFTI